MSEQGKEGRRAGGDAVRRKRSSSKDTSPACSRCCSASICSRCLAASCRSSSARSARWSRASSRRSRAARLACAQPGGSVRFYWKWLLRPGPGQRINDRMMQALRRCHWNDYGGHGEPPRAKSARTESLPSARRWKPATRSPCAAPDDRKERHCLSREGSGTRKAKAGSYALSRRTPGGPACPLGAASCRIEPWWISVLLLEWLRREVLHPGFRARRTHLRSRSNSPCCVAPADRREADMDILLSSDRRRSSRPDCSRGRISDATRCKAPGCVSTTLLEWLPFIYRNGYTTRDGTLRTSMARVRFIANSRQLLRRDSFRDWHASRAALSRAANPAHCFSNHSSGIRSRFFFNAVRSLMSSSSARTLWSPQLLRAEAVRFMYWSPDAAEAERVDDVSIGVVVSGGREVRPAPAVAPSSHRGVAEPICFTWVSCHNRGAPDTPTGRRWPRGSLSETSCSDVLGSRASLCPPPPPQRVSGPPHPGPEVSRSVVHTLPAH